MIVVLAVGVAAGCRWACFGTREAKPGQGSANLANGSGNKTDPQGKGNSIIFVYVYHI